MSNAEYIGRYPYSADIRLDFSRYTFYTIQLAFGDTAYRVQYGSIAIVRNGTVEVSTTAISSGCGLLGLNFKIREGILNLYEPNKYFVVQNGYAGYRDDPNTISEYLMVDVYGYKA